jgi:hypothetical protein
MDPGEAEVLERFANKGALRGTFFTDVGLGTDDFWGVVDAVFVEGLDPEREPRILASRWWKTLLDEIRGRGKGVLVIEVKRELNYEAIGQAIVYRQLFPRVWGLPVIGSAILCEEASPTLEGVCRANGIQVFRA